MTRAASDRPGYPLVRTRGAGADGSGTLPAFLLPNASDLPTNQCGLVRASRVKSSRGIFVAACLGLGFVGLGFDLLARYANTPGRKVVAPTVWPVKSRLTKPTRLPMLVMFAHP